MKFEVWSQRAIPADLAVRLDGLANIRDASAIPRERMYENLSGVHAMILANGAGGADVMDLSPELLLIARTGIGYDQVDIAAATERGIAVCNTPDAPTISTAEHAVMLLFAAAKKLRLAEHLIRTERGIDFYGRHRSIELYGKTLGLIGFGRIGRHVATICRAVGMKIAAYDPFLNPQSVADLDVTLVPDLATLLGSADVVSLHLPATPETYRMINRETLGQFKTGALFVNASRGTLVDEAALIEALDSGRLAGAALDVTDPEPPDLDSPLLQRSDVVVTPHVASASADGRHRIFADSVENVAVVLRGDKPATLINPEVWPLVEEKMRRLRS